MITVDRPATDTTPPAPEPDGYPGSEEPTDRLPVVRPAAPRGLRCADRSGRPRPVAGADIAGLAFDPPARPAPPVTPPTPTPAPAAALAA